MGTQNRKKPIRAGVLQTRRTIPDTAVGELKSGKPPKDIRRPLFQRLALPGLPVLPRFPRSPFSPGIPGTSSQNHRPRRKLIKLIRDQGILRIQKPP